MSPKLLTCAIAFVAVALWMPTATAQDAAEKLQYDISWGYADVANLTLQRACARKGYRPASMKAKSVGIANQIHEFDIRLDSFTKPDSLHPLEGRTMIFEDEERRSFQSRFEENLLVRVQKVFKDKTQKFQLTLPAVAHDLLSWVFALRVELPKPEASKSYYVWDGWKLVRLEATTQPLEHVWTPLGVYDAWPVALHRTRLHHSGLQVGTPKGSRERIGTLWIANDTARTPVAMDFTGRVGVAKVRLKTARRVQCSGDSAKGN